MINEDFNQLVKIQDSHNKDKVWHIFKTKNGMYYYNFEINGKMVNGKFKRATTHFLKNIFKKEGNK